MSRGSGSVELFYRWAVRRMKKVFIRDLILLVLLLGLLPRAESADRVPVTGKVMFGDTPLCAMVLANGQNMFSCSGDGSFNLSVPLDKNGQVTLFTFAQGFAPYRQTLSPAQVVNITVDMLREPESRTLSVSYSTSDAQRSGWVVVKGSIDFSGTPVCALMLANGQHMFSCNDTLGRFSLEVPLDNSGKVTLFAFVSGFQPSKAVFPAPGGGKTLVFNTAGILEEGSVDWAAYRDGDGPWQRWYPTVTQAEGDVYTASITNGKGRYSFAYHQSYWDASLEKVEVNHSTLSEQRVWFDDGVVCGSFSGILTTSAGTDASINGEPVSGGGASVPFRVTHYCMLDAPSNDIVDLVVTQDVDSHDPFGFGRPERFLIKRNMATMNGSIAGLDLNLVSGGVGTRTAGLTITESDGSDIVQVIGTFLTANDGMAFISDAISDTSSTLYLPASGVLATDALLLSVSSMSSIASRGKAITRITAAQGFTSDNINLDWIKPMDFESYVDLGNWPNTVDITYTPGPNSPPILYYLLTGATNGLYDSGTVIRWVTATPGWLLGSNTIAIGNLDTVAGYNTAWNVVPGGGYSDEVFASVFMGDRASLDSPLEALDVHSEFGDYHQVFATCRDVNSRCSRW